MTSEDDILSSMQRTPLTNHLLNDEYYLLNNFSKIRMHTLQLGVHLDWRSVDSFHLPSDVGLNPI